jgi:hypothetical protein
VDGGFLRLGLIALYFGGFLKRANNNINLGCNHNRNYACDPMISKQNHSKNDPALEFCGDPANSPNSGARLAPLNPTQPKVSSTEESTYKSLGLVRFFSTQGSVEYQATRPYSAAIAGDHS